MSDPTYNGGVDELSEKPLVWLHGEIKTPPFSKAGRIDAGTLLGRLQEGETLGMPLARPMPDVGARCYELRVRDEAHNWRIMYRCDGDAIVILDVFPKATQRTPKHVIERCRRRLKLYDEAKKNPKKDK